MIRDCKLTNIKNVHDARGNIAFLQSYDIPFVIKRIYYIYSIPDAANRGAHAHRNLHQFMIAINGSFKISLFDGSEKKDFILDNPEEGLYIPPMIWRDMSGFKNNSICLVAASENYDEGDYYRDYDEFTRDAKSNINCS